MAKGRRAEKGNQKDVSLFAWRESSALHMLIGNSPGKNTVFDPIKKKRSGSEASLVRESQDEVQRWVVLLRKVLVKSSL